MNPVILAASPDVQGLTVAVFSGILGSSLLAGLVTTVLTGWRASAAARRDRYAAAVEAVVAWAEYPYRVRRRVNDDPETLAKLADLGHDLQECLARNRAWVAAESTAVAYEFDVVIEEARRRVGDSIMQAWKASPVSTAAEMIVAPFGPGDMTAAFNRLNSAVRWRFGWRRMLPSLFVHWRLGQQRQRSG